MVPLSDAIGYVPLQIIPSMQGIGGNLTAGFAPFVSAGRQAGQDAGRAAASGVAAARADVEKASEALAKARDKEADAAGKVRIAEEKVNELRERGITSGSQYTAAVERLATANRNALRTTETATRAQNDHAEATRRARDATDDAEQSQGRFRTGLSNLGGSIDSNVKKLAGMAVATAGVGSAMELAMSAMDNAKVNDKLAASLGATPEMAAQYGSIAGRLYSDAYGESMADVSSSVGTVVSELQYFGVEGEAAVESITAKAMNFGQAFDSDISESVSAARNLIYQGLAPDAESAFDMMTAAYQKVPESMRGELPEIIAEYGTNFRALGFEGQDAFNLLIGASLEGKFALDKTGDALKEFTIRGSDMSKNSIAAYESVGLNAELMSSRIAEGGPGAQAALQETAQAILGIEDPAQRANTAIALFGTPIEDLSVDQIPAFLSTLGGIPDYMGDVSGAADNMGNTLNDNAATSLETVKRQIESGFIGALQNSAVWITENQGLAQGLAIGVGALGAAWVAYKVVMVGVQVASSAAAGVAAAGTAAAWVGSAATTAGAWISLRVEAAALWVTAQAQAIGAAIASSAAWVTSTATTAAAWVSLRIEAAALWLTAQAQAVGAALASAGAWVAANARIAASFLITRGAMVAATVATGAMTAAQWLFNAALNANPIGLITIAIAALVGGLIWFFTQTEIGRNIVTAAWEAIKVGWDWLYAALSTGISAVGDALGWLGDKAGEVKDWIVGKWNDMVGFVTSLPGKISSAASGMWNGIQEAFKGAINWIIRAWNSLEFRIPGFSVGPVKWDGFTLGLPDLPYFRDGGPVSGPGTSRSDSILARLSNGEFVVPARGVNDATMPLLEAIRGGWVPSPGFLHAMVGGFGALASTGDFDGALSKVGIEEDHPIVSGVLDLRSLLGFADGGLVTADQLNKFPRENGLEGAVYDWGGVNWGDCSGAMSALANFAVGRDPFGSRFATGNQAEELAARGFKPGLGPAGSFNLGWYNGGPYGGHTAGTLPDGTNVEMGGARGDGQVGGMAAGAADSMFTDHAHLPPEFFLGGDPNVSGGAGGGSFAGMPSGSVGSGGSLSGGGGGGGATGIGGTFGGGNAGEVKIAGGDAQPVWVTNWPASGGSFSAPVDPMATDGAQMNSTSIADVAPPDSAPLGGGSVDEQYQGPTGEDVGAIGTDFAKANVDQFLSDLGLSSSPGGLLGGLIAAVDELRPIVEEHVHYHVDSAREAVREHTSAQREKALGYNTGRRG